MCQRPLEVRAVSPADDGAADLIRGGGPYAGPRIGLASGLPVMPDEGRPRGFPCQIGRGSVTSWVFCGPVSSSFAPADRRWRESQRDLTRGDGPYACWRIGLASCLPR